MVGRVSVKTQTDVAVEQLFWNRSVELSHHVSVTARHTGQNYFSNRLSRTSTELESGQFSISRYNVCSFY